MNILLASVLMTALSYAYISLEQALYIVWGLWFILLPVHTWRDYLAGMSFDRMKHGGAVKLPVDPEEFRNEPDAQRVVKYFLYLPAAAKNFLLAQFGALLYFHVFPIPWKDVGLTKLLNRLSVKDGKLGEKARHVQKRWLDRYDRRGKHT